MTSIRYKFISAIMLTAVVSLLFTATAMVTYNLYNYKTTVSNSLIAHTSFLARSVKSAVEFGDVDNAKNYVTLLASQADVIAASVYDHDGRLITSYGIDLADPRLDELETLHFEGNRVTLSKAIENNQGRIGFVVVALQYAYKEQLAGNVSIAVLVFVLAASLALGLSIWLQTSITRPILKVSDLAHKIISERDYSLRAEKSSDDETGKMVDAINAMLTEVQKRDQELAESNRKLTLEVSERIEIEKALRASEQRVREHAIRMETANQELESFSYSVSHDLRTPLRALDGFSQALLEDYDAVLDDEGKHFLNRIRAASQRMGILIDDLLKLSRVTRSDLAIEKIDLSAMVEQIANELMVADPDRQVAFHITPGIQAACDRHMIKIALDNLVQNAWKYTSKQTISRIEFGHRPHGAHDVIYIKDNGVGYDMKYAGKLFGAFQRLHSATEFPGTGIGLATVRRILRRHGGDIWGEAKPGEGAVFYFSFNADARHQASNNNHKTEAMRGEQ